MAKENKPKVEKKKEEKKKEESSAKTTAKKKFRKKILKIFILAALLFLINLYIVLGIIYKKGGFTITLDYEEGKEAGLIIYESPTDKTEKTYLRCEDIDFLSDISVDWIPDSVNDEADGSHHGHHYMAYTFYAENVGEEPINYWMTAIVDKQEKGADEALRFMVYKNGEKTVYAKRATNGQPEPDTIPFKDETTAMLEQRKNLMPGEIDKYTIVVFLEGNDPQCVNDILGGEISMHMTITEEHITDETQLPEDYLKQLLQNNEEDDVEENSEENS